MQKKMGLFKMYGWKRTDFGFEILLPLKNGLFVGENISMADVERMSEIQLQREIERKTALCKHNQRVGG
jgi:hypothetical protein